LRGRHSHRHAVTQIGNPEVAYGVYWEGCARVCPTKRVRRGARPKASSAERGMTDQISRFANDLAQDDQESGLTDETNHTYDVSSYAEQAVYEGRDKTPSTRFKNISASKGFVRTS